MDRLIILQNIKNPITAKNIAFKCSVSHNTISIKNPKMSYLIDPLNTTFFCQPINNNALPFRVFFKDGHPTLVTAKSRRYLHNYMVGTMFCLSNTPANLHLAAETTPAHHFNNLLTTF